MSNGGDEIGAVNFVGGEWLCTLSAHFVAPVRTPRAYVAQHQQTFSGLLVSLDCNKFEIAFDVYRMTCRAGFEVRALFWK